MSIQNTLLYSLRNHIFWRSTNKSCMIYDKLWDDIIYYSELTTQFWFGAKCRYRPKLMFLYTIRPFEYPIFVYSPNTSGLFSSVKPVELRDNWVQHWSKNNKFDDLMLNARYTWSYKWDKAEFQKNFKVSNLPTHVPNEHSRPASQDPCDCPFPSSPLLIAHSTVQWMKVEIRGKSNCLLLQA